MGETVKYGQIQKPVEKDLGSRVEKVVEFGVRSVAPSSFDRRPASGSAAYIGPSKVEARASKIAAGHKQQKKHVSSGRGQG